MKNNNNKLASSWTQRLFNATVPNKTDPHRKTYYAHLQTENQVSANYSCFSELFCDKNQPNAETHRDFAELLSQKNHRIADLKLTHLLTTETTSKRNTDTRFTVLNCYYETPDTKTFRLARISGEPLEYLPGQYMTLTVTIAGKEYKRSYSLASSPANTGIVEITVKRDSNGGLVSNWLVDYINVGDTLNLKGPFGKFTCAVDTPNKILFLAAGSGIVPIISMLRWLADTEKTVDIVLLLSCRTRDDIIYWRDLELITSRHRNIKLYITITKNSPTMQWAGLTGRVNKDMLAGLLTDIPERAIYLCGPDAFMAECRQLLQALGHPQEQLYCESFRVDLGQTKQSASAGLSAVSRAPGEYQVRFVRSGINVITDGKINLLELAEQSCVKIDHECRSGSCGECMVKCLDGEVDLAGQAEIDEIDRKKGWVYACCAFPTSNVQLDI